MDNFTSIGVDTLRKEAYDKVTGIAKYVDDTIEPGILHGKILTSKYAHAIIKSVVVAEFCKIKI